MQCPKCKTWMTSKRLDERTSQQECPGNGCGYSRIVEIEVGKDGVQSGRELLTDDMGSGSGKQLNG